MLADDVRGYLRLFAADEGPIADTPSVNRWIALLSGLVSAHRDLEQLPDSTEIDALVEEVEAALCGWPDELRFASYGKIYELGAGAPLSAARWTGRLVRTLTVDSNGLDGERMRQLFALWPNVTQIDFDEVMIEDDGYDVLFDPPGSRLSGLQFVSCELDDEAVDRLSASPLSRRLRRLALFENVTDEAVARLIGALPELTDLKLAHASPAVARALALGRAPMTLQHLGLGPGACRADVFRELVATSWRALDRVVLEAAGYPRATTRGGDEGWLDVLLGSSLLTDVRELDLSQSKIGTDGVEALASVAFGRLEVLRLHNLTNRGASALAAAPFMAQVKLLSVRGDFGPGAATALQRALTVGLLDDGRSPA